MYVAFESQIAYHNNIAVGQNEVRCLGSCRTLVKTNELVLKRCVAVSKTEDDPDQGYTVPSLSFTDREGMVDLRQTLANDKGEIVDETRCWVQRFELPAMELLQADRIFVVLRSMSWSDLDDSEQSSDKMICDDEEEKEEECDEEPVQVFTRADLANECKNHCCLQHSESAMDATLHMERRHAKNADTEVSWMSWIEELLVSE